MKKILTVGLIFLLGLTACQSGAEKPVGEAPKENDTPKQNEILSATSMYESFTKEHADQTIQKFALKHKQNGSFYKIEAYDDQSEYEYVFSAKDGNQIKFEKDSLDKERGSLTLEDLEKAMHLLKQTDKEVSEEFILSQWEAKFDDHLKKFEIEYKNEKNQEMEYLYNLETGDLIKKELDD